MGSEMCIRDRKRGFKSVKVGIEEALKNIKEVIELCIEEKTKTIEQREISLHLVPVRV